MGDKTKKFCIGRSGKTIDGREIQPQWLYDAAELYDPAKYCARINLEHYLAFFPNNEFRAYGDVVSLETRDIDSGHVELWAGIKPTPELVKLVNSDQKVFTSMELVTDFDGTGKAYLIGLAATDTPASLNTSRLQFSQINKFIHNLIVSEPIEMTQKETQTQQVNTKEPEKKESFISQAFAAVFSGKKDKEEKESIIAAQAKDIEQGEAVIKELFAQNKTLQEENVALVERFSALEAKIQKLGSTADTPEREAHTGGDASFYSAIDY